MEIDSSRPNTHLQVARADAIEGFASIELSLCQLLAHLLGATLERAGIVFFRLTNTHSRNTILDSLLRSRYGDQFHTYWHGTKGTPEAGLFKLIRQLDSCRNEIVHWRVALNIAMTESGVVKTQALVPPNVFAFSGATPSLTIQDLIEFSAKADFVWRSLNNFNSFTSGSMGEHPNFQTWQEIFRQPVVYPPPDTHPLSRSQKVP